MVAFKAAQVGKFLKAPDPAIRAILLYGPDPALTADHASTLAKRLAQDGDPAAEIVRLDDRDLAEDPGRLLGETQTLSMFASRKVVRVTAGARFPVDDVAELLAGLSETHLIVEAGSLRPSAKLRKAFEAAAAAAALPCYEVSPRDMSAFIADELGQLGVTIADDARAHLVALFGGDQARARMELGKLALYAADSGTLSIEDVDAVTGDISQGALDTLTACAGARDRAEALRQLDRLLATGQAPQGVIAALQRHFERLHRVCAALEEGKPARGILDGFRPPLHFKQRDMLESQSRQWTRPRAAKALDLIATATRTARWRPEIERQLAARLLIALTQ